jgi:hypothetical protein
MQEMSMDEGLTPLPPGLPRGAPFSEGKLMPVDSLQKQDDVSHDGRCGRVEGTAMGSSLALRWIIKGEGLQACAVADVAALGPDWRHNFRERVCC